MHGFLQKRSMHSSNEIFDTEEEPWDFNELKPPDIISNMALYLSIISAHLCKCEYEFNIASNFLALCICEFHIFTFEFSKACCEHQTTGSFERLSRHFHRG